MKKIGRIVGRCEECEHCRRYNDPRANYGCVCVCLKTTHIVKMDSVINHDNRVAGISIPSDCPLDDYVGSSSIYKDEE